MCGSFLSSTFLRITKPSEKVKMNYIVPIEKYNVDLTNLTEIKIVGGEPLMEKKHDEFVDKLKGMPIIN